MFESDSAGHGAVVDAFFAARPQSNEGLVDSLGAGLGIIWRRAERTMGAVTLAAIAGRVLHEASKQFPFLDGVEEGDHGIELSLLRSRADALPSGDLQSAAKLVLVRFLSVLGNLTADVLTPALHAELTNAHDDEGKNS